MTHAETFLNLFFKLKVRNEAEGANKSRGQKHVAESLRDSQLPASRRSRRLDSPGVSERLAYVVRLHRDVGMLGQLSLIGSDTKAQGIVLGSLHSDLPQNLGSPF